MQTITKEYCNYYNLFLNFCVEETYIFGMCVYVRDEVTII